MPLPRIIGTGRALLAGGGVASFTDAFDRADGALGNGWEGATWAIVSGKAVNTPGTTGSEILGNPGFETWTNATTPGTWNKTTAGTSSVNQESSDVHGGTYAARLDVDGSNSNVQIDQSGGSQHKPIRIEVWAKASVGGNLLSIIPLNGAAIIVWCNLTTSYAKYVASVQNNGVNSFFMSYRRLGIASIYLDDFSVKQLALPQVFAVQNFGVAAPAVVRAAITQGGTHAAGVVANLDNLSNPQNYVIAYHSGPQAGTNAVHLIKCVAGVVTTLISSTVTYVAGAMIEIRRTSDGKYQLWYNNVQRGTDQTIADAGIISNTYHGMYSLYEGNSVDSFFVGTP